MGTGGIQKERYTQGSASHTRNVHMHLTPTATTHTTQECGHQNVGTRNNNGNIPAMRSLYMGFFSAGAAFLVVVFLGGMVESMTELAPREKMCVCVAHPRYDGLI